MSFGGKLKEYFKNILTILSFCLLIAGIVLFVVTLNKETPSAIVKLLFLGLAILGGYGMVESWRNLEKHGFCSKSNKSNQNLRRIHNFPERQILSNQNNNNLQEFNEEDIPNCFKKLSKKTGGTGLNIRIRNNNSNEQMHSPVQQTPYIQTENNSVNAQPSYTNREEVSQQIYTNGVNQSQQSYNGRVEMPQENYSNSVESQQPYVSNRVETPQENVSNNAETSQNNKNLESEVPNFFIRLAQKSIDEDKKD